MIYIDSLRSYWEKNCVKDRYILASKKNRIVQDCAGMSAIIAVFFFSNNNNNNNNNSGSK